MSLFNSRLMPRGLLAACAGAMLIACAPAPVKTFDEGQSVAFGRVVVIKDGERIENMQGISHDFTSGAVILLRPGQKKADLITLAGNGEFYWDLAPGDYSLVAFQYFSGGARHSIGLNTDFAVPPATSVYVGDLVVQLEDGRYGFGIADSFEEMRASLATAHPGHPPAVTSDLMQFEPPIGHFSAVRGVCASAWGIECESHQYGVKPLDPVHRRGEYTEVASLTPTLRWSGSTRPDVHYDLIVRRAVSCDSMVLLTEGLPGDIVYYREDLATNSHTLEEPLEPDSNYLWSVRFREGDVVSQWSSGGHFAFFIIGFSGSSGEWFRFCTPAAG